MMMYRFIDVALCVSRRELALKSCNYTLSLNDTPIHGVGFCS
jgi:hypothetical protein